MIHKNSCFLHAGDYAPYVDKKHHMCYTEKKHYISNLRNSNHQILINSNSVQEISMLFKIKISREIADVFVMFCCGISGIS